MFSKPFTFLALGDSYTIGEGVAIFENFPYQTVQLLRKAGNNFNAPEIFARTGWTSEELKIAIRGTIFQTSYDFVSLLIGVNDQYDKKDLRDYSVNLEILIRLAISFANNKPDHVFVFSIPNWGLTPFAADKNTVAITKEIDAFNEVTATKAAQFGVHYIDMTHRTQEPAPDLSFLAHDLLHPSGKEYAKWSVRLTEEIQKLLV